MGRLGLILLTLLLTFGSAWAQPPGGPGGPPGGVEDPGLQSFHTETPIIVADGTPVYASLSGELSTTQSNVGTIIEKGATFRNLQCSANINTSEVLTAILGEGPCNSNSNYSNKAQVIMVTSANSPGTSSGATTIFPNECGRIRFTVASGTSATVSIRCSYQKVEN